MSRGREYFKAAQKGMSIYLVIGVIQIVLQAVHKFPVALLKAMQEGNLTSSFCVVDSCSEYTALTTHIVLLLGAGLAGLGIMSIVNLVKGKPKLEKVEDSRTLIRRY